MRPRKKRKLRAKWPEWISAALLALRPPEQLTVSQFADKYRVLDEKTSAQPGQWRTSVTPYLEGIMNAFNEVDVEEIILCKPTQVGGTECLNNMIAYSIAQDPSPMLVVYPTLELAEFSSKNRIQPMIDLVPVLKERYHIQDSKLLELQLDGMYIVFAGANSPASLSHRPVRYLLMDEVDKYPPNSGREADPISLARERTKTFNTNKKVFMASTPTVKKGNIWQELQKADEVRYYQVPCPHCGHFQKLRFKQLKWPKDYTKPADARDMAYYECEACKGKITDAHKITMLRNGRWIAEEKKSEYSRKVAFHFNTLYSPWVRFGDVAYTFLKSKEFPDMLRNFINSWLAEPWEQTEVKMNSDKVLDRQSKYEDGMVPDGTLLITGGVDVQMDHFYYTVRAWGTTMTSWNIAHGIAESWEQVENVMNYPYQDDKGQVYQVNLCAVDSGDRTDEVYDFCAINREWAVPVKGSSNPLLARYNISTIDRVDSKANGLRLYIVDGGQYKDMIAGRLNRPNGPGSWMVYEGCDRDYAEQICAEEKIVEKRGGREIEVWRPKGSHAANHFLDCEVYAALAADLLQVRYLQLNDGQPQRNNMVTEREQLNENYSRTNKISSSWLPQKEGGWIK